MIDNENSRRLLDMFRNRTLAENENDDINTSHKKYEGKLPETLFDLIQLLDNLVEGRHDDTLVVFADVTPGQDNDVLDVKPDQYAGGRLTYKAEYENPEQPAATYLNRLVKMSLDKLPGTGIKQKTDLMKKTTFGFTLLGKAFKLSEIYVDFTQFSGDSTGDFMLELHLVQAGSVSYKNAHSKKRPDKVDDLVKEISRLRTDSGREIGDQKFVCEIGGDIFSCIPNDAATTNAVAVFMLYQIHDVADEQYAWTYDEITQWIQKKCRPGSVMFFKCKKDVYEIERMTFKAGDPPIVKMRPWGGMDESCRRILAWYGNKTLVEDEEYGSPRLAHDEFKGKLPENLHDLLKAMHDTAGKHADKAMILFFDQDGTKDEPLELQSGEIVGGQMLYTLIRLQPNIRPNPIPLGLLTGKSIDELKAGTHAQKLELAKTTPFGFVVSGRRFDLKSICLDTMRFPDDPTIWYFMNIGLEEASEKQQAKSAPAGQTTYSKKRPNKAGDLLREVAYIQNRSGRQIGDMPFVCEIDDAMYSCIPSQSTEKTTTFILQKMTQADDIDETWTVKEIIRWIYQKDNLESVMFFKYKQDVYEIESLLLEAGRPPVVLLRPWGGMDESKKTLSESQREILEWKKYCDSDILYW